MLVDTEIILKEESICFLDALDFKETVMTLLEGGFEKEKQKKIYEKILERESVISTSIGKGIAIPHGRCDFLESFHLMIGLCREDAFGWKGIDNIAIQIVCVLVGPEDRQREYLGCLSKITAVLKEEKTRLEILGQREKKNIVNIFQSC